ncbi:hypothetical protein Vadar_007818 [Vaccinium darrowii]|uniref:Uncharacterized protein n=1 Tax=Vaccinium darrowii TaxID=229202 RepID=A0ACB7YKE3_9ERIC|nr:hypothetical protein Vadar_007818 [Vaccinium darrowii]
MAKHFEELVGMDKRFEVVVPRNFSMVCFRVSPSAVSDSLKSCDKKFVNEFNHKLLASINETGRVYMTHDVVGGVYLIRFAIGVTSTDYQHVNMAWGIIQDRADAMLVKS